MLVASNGKGLLETGFGLDHLWDGLLQQQGTLEPIRLGEQIPMPVGLQHGPGLGQPPQPVLDLAHMPRRLGEQKQTERVRLRMPRVRDGGHPLAELRQARRILALAEIMRQRQSSGVAVKEELAMPKTLLE